MQFSMSISPLQTPASPSLQPELVLCSPLAGILPGLPQHSRIHQEEEGGGGGGKKRNKQGKITAESPPGAKNEGMEKEWSAGALPFSSRLTFKRGNGAGSLR